MTYYELSCLIYSSIYLLLFIVSKDTLHILIFNLWLIVFVFLHRGAL